MNRYYRIGEFADLGGVSEKTLRFYDEIGLLRPAAVDPRTRYRLYLAQQLRDLASILALKELGVTLADLREVNRRGRPKEERRQVILNLKKTIEHSLAAATQTLQSIDAALDEMNQGPDPMPIVVKRRPSALIASIRSRVNSYADMERFERELFAELPQHSIGKVRGALWHHCADSDYLEGEVFVALKGRVPSRSVYDVKELPAATLACTYSCSDDRSAESGYDAIRKWIDTRGYRLAAAKREIYLDNMLEIQFPVKS